MSLRRSFVWILSAGMILALTGCPSDPPRTDAGTDGGGIILDDAGMMEDAGTDAFVPPATRNVNQPGTVPGANCNRGTCNGGLGFRLVVGAGDVRRHHRPHSRIHSEGYRPVRRPGIGQHQC